jgi:hypothetical protein
MWEGEQGKKGVKMGVKQKIYNHRQRKVIWKMDKKLSQLLTHYSNADEEIIKQLSSRSVDEAWPFLSSDLLELDLALRQVLRSSLISRRKWFCDAGAGDGRVIALVAAKYNIPSIGAEFNSFLCRVAKKNIGQLRGVTGSTPAIVAEGNFADDGTYAKAGVRFEDIGIFFNFVTGENLLAKKIATQSPDGTVLLLYGPKKVKKNLHGLKLEATVDSWGECKKKKIPPLHLYRKSCF